MAELTEDHDRLHAALVQEFSLDELDLLCVKLGVDPDRISGRNAGRDVRAMEMQLYFERASRIEEFITAVSKERPALSAMLADWLDEIKRPIPCPYPGMISFDANDSRFFHGREQEIERVLLHLRQQHFLCVIGPSGCGKSSLISAGVLPRLTQGENTTKDYWLVRVMRPGDDALGVLSNAIGGEPDDVLALLDAHAPAQRLLLVIDQFEEIFTHARDTPLGRRQIREFIDKLKALRSMTECAVIVVVRADFYPDLINSPLWPIEPAQRLEIAPLRDEALLQAMRKPAEAVGVSLEPALLDHLMADAADEPGVLPLIQETMRLLWARMEHRVLILRAYEQIASAYPDARSGLAVAIAARAEATYATLEAPARAIADRILLRLVAFVPGREALRQQQSIRDLRSSLESQPAFDQVMQRLAMDRLLTLSDDRITGNEKGDQKADLAHEAMLAGWPMLQGLIARLGDAEKKRRWLEGRVSEWARLDGQGGLLDGTEIHQAEAWLKSDDATRVGYSHELVNLITASRRALNPGWNSLGVTGMLASAVALVALGVLAWLVAQAQVEALRGSIALAIVSVLGLLAIGFGVLRRSDRYAGQRLSQRMARQRSLLAGAGVLCAGAMAAWAVWGVQTAQVMAYCGSPPRSFEIANDGITRIAVSIQDDQPYFAWLVGTVLSTHPNTKAWVVEANDVAKCRSFFIYRVLLQKTAPAQDLVGYIAVIDPPLPAEKTTPGVARRSISCDMFAELAYDVAEQMGLAAVGQIYKQENSSATCEAYILNEEGYEALNRNQLEQAELKLRRAITLSNETFSVPFNNLGLVLLKRGAAAGDAGRAAAYYREARDVLSRAVQLYGIPDHLTNLGNACYRLKAYDCAAVNYRRALDIDSGYIQAHLNLSTLERDAGNFKESERWLAQAQPLLTTTVPLENQQFFEANLHRLWGILNYYEGNYTQSIMHLKEALRLFVYKSQMEDSQYYLAMDFMRLNDTRMACGAWKQYDEITSPSYLHEEYARRADAITQQQKLNCPQVFMSIQGG